GVSSPTRTGWCSATASSTRRLLSTLCIAMDGASLPSGTGAGSPGQIFIMPDGHPPLPVTGSRSGRTAWVMSGPHAGGRTVGPARVRLGHAWSWMSAALEQGVSKMIIDCAHYMDGARRDEGAVALEEAAARTTEGGFVWLGLFEPGAEELAQVRA